MLKTLSTRGARAVVLTACVFPFAACVDAKARFDEFGQRIPIDATPVDAVDAPIVDMLPNIDGMWLIAVDPKPIVAGAYIQILATLDITITGATGELDGSYQPLHTYMNDMANPPDSPLRVPVGPNPTPAVLQPLIANDVAVDNTASFSARLTGVLPSSANTASGVQYDVDITLHGTIQSMTLICGTVTGSVGPIPSVAGSTFAAIPSANPLPAPIGECPAAVVGTGVAP